MSYCRFAEGDVYAYVCGGGVQFYVSDGKRELDRLCNTFNEAHQYARVLRDTHGLDVPSHAIEALKADALEEAARICGPDSAVAELEAENEKLRELCRHLYACNQYCDREESDGGCSACSYQLLECDCGFEERLLELGIEVD